MGITKAQNRNSHTKKTHRKQRDLSLLNTSLKMIQSLFVSKMIFRQEKWRPGTTSQPLTHQHITLRLAKKYFSQLQCLTSKIYNDVYEFIQINSSLIIYYCVIKFISNQSMATVLPEQPDKRSLLMIVLPSLYGFFLLIYTLFVIVCICRRSKGKSNKVQPELQSQKSSQQNNNQAETIKVESLQQVKNQSDSTITTRNQKMYKDDLVKNGNKSRKRRSPLVVQQVKESENSYEQFRNIEQLRSPTVNKPQQNYHNLQNQSLSYLDYQATETKRKLFQKNRRQKMSRRRNNKANKNLIYQQYNQ